MSFSARWPETKPGTGMYESFYMRAASPTEPVGVWIRFTVQKAAGQPPKGSIWFTLFDERRGRPVARKSTFDLDRMSTPEGGWISIADSSFTPNGIQGQVEDCRWSFSFTDADRELHHLPRDWMYRTPLPKTKPESPVPFGRFSGEVTCGDRTFELDAWPGMIGHNWGAEHAWTWVWLSGAGFEEDPDAWIDVVLGRLKIAGKVTPWIANGAISANGRRHRLGGLLRRGTEVNAEPGGATMVLPGEDGFTARVKVEAPQQSTVCWNYGGPSGHVHDVLNCSIARLGVNLTSRPGEPGTDTTLSTGHGGTYELGLPGRQNWVAPEPYPDEW